MLLNNTFGTILQDDMATVVDGELDLNLLPFNFYRILIFGAVYDFYGYDSLEESLFTKSFIIVITTSWTLNDLKHFDQGSLSMKVIEAAFGWTWQHSSVLKLIHTSRQTQIWHRDIFILCT